MATLGMTLQDTLSPVTKVQFNKWHSEGNLKLVGAGHQDTGILLSRLNDINADWRSNAIDVSRADLSKHDTVHMFSNGCDEFVIILNDMQASEYNRNYYQDTGKQHATVYLAQ